MTEPAPTRLSERLVALGASTGGTEAIRELLLAMPADAPAIVIAQHMPEQFTRALAERLDSVCRMRVKEAEAGERAQAGHAYIAPGHSHMLVGRSAGHYVIELSQDPPVNRHRPSVDLLFRSVARSAGANAVGVLLTGMGKDGAQGLLELRRTGAHTIVQDQQTSVVFGMPREAVNLGAAREVLPLRSIASHVLAALAQAAQAQGAEVVRLLAAPGGHSSAPRCQPILHGEASFPRTTAMHANVQTEPGRARILLTGRFDFSAHRVFRDSYTPSLDSGSVSELEVDLAQVDYLDSSALGMLLMLREKAQTANKTVTLSNCRGSVRQVLEIANFGKLFTIK
jgi:two-component system, chemotaxis family, protein-glutamate methylesterase/glutaminase